MKKVNIIIMFLCAFGFTANAQDMKFGVKSSFSMSFFTGKDIKTATGPGYSVGGFFQYNVLDNIGVSIAPAYARKQVNRVDFATFFDNQSPLFYNTVTNEYFDFKPHFMTSSVIELPVMVNFIVDMGGFNIRPFGGPAFDFVLNSKFHSERVVAPYNDDFFKKVKFYSDVTDRVPSTEIGAIAGVGADFETPVGDLMIELFYRRGFTNYNKVEGKPKVYTNYFGLTVGLGLDKLVF